MREVNFSIPNVNKASVGITTALYDRRALDCTSTLPLINSLNHLAYLTTSSARIRDILTVDGGVERLVCILKQGRSQEMMEMWKWNLAFQCVVNIGVRGSEAVRTRVVEADMVPVIATILDNYIQVIDKCREKAEAEQRRTSLQSLDSRANRSTPRTSRSPTERSPLNGRGLTVPTNRPFRRHDPPPSIEIPQTFPPPGFRQLIDAQTDNGAVPPPPPPPPPLPPPDLQAVAPVELLGHARPHRHHHHSHHHHRHHHHHRSADSRIHVPNVQNVLHSNSRHAATQSTGAISPTSEEIDGPSVRPVREIDRLPSMLPSAQAGITSQPDSPTTPNAPTIMSQSSILGRVSHRRASVVQRQENSGDSDDGNVEEDAPEAQISNDEIDEPMIDIQTTVDIQGADDTDSMLDSVDMPIGLTAPNPSEEQDAETFSITHRPAVDSSVISVNVTPTPPNAVLPPPPPHVNVVNVTPSPMPPQNMHARFMLDRSAPPAILAATPRDEDVLMSLQLLAYVSKYCNLRTYFQQSHLVPRLKIGKDLNMLDEGGYKDLSPMDIAQEEEEQEEYLLPDDFNMFPLVEKFTVRHHSHDMQHWAGVVMRNLCRKDDDKGGIRQCAYYQCGKWEQYTRQFAKCRRCRRTKYCSKECQKAAWVYHRHWCQIAQQGA